MIEEMPGGTVSDLGEFPLISRLGRILEDSAKPSGMVIGMGDDTAALEFGEGKLCLATTDIMIEDVHFKRNGQSPVILGRRIVAVNLSDIAAMGGKPKYSLISLGLPKDLPVSFVDQLYKGIVAESRIFGFGVAGGNVASSPDRLVLDVTMLGEAEAGRVLRRSGAKVGDSILVTNSLGDSAAGLAIILDGLGGALPQWVKAALLAAHSLPRPRVREGMVIADSELVTAMIDTSDGLGSDLGHICEASGVGARVFAEDMPRSLALYEFAKITGRDPLELALYGGEDYELLFTVRPGSEVDVQKRLQNLTGASATVIGRIEPPENGMTVRLPDETERPLRQAGFDHLRRMSS